MALSIRNIISCFASESVNQLAFLASKTFGIFVFGADGGLETVCADGSG
jgi:hypothetical protein